MGLYFFYLKYVPLIQQFQIVLVPVLFMVFTLTLINFDIGTLSFIFFIPLINILPYFFGINENIPHAPTALVLFLFYFLGFLLHTAIFRRKFTFRHRLFHPMALFSLLIFSSALVTVLRYANFFPFLSDSIYELTTNVNGVSAGGAITSVIFSSLNYITGFFFFFLMLNFLSSKNAVKKAIIVLGTSALLSMSFGMYQSIFNQDIGKNLLNIEMNLVNGTFKDSLSLGVFLALTIPFFLGAVFSFKGMGRVFSFVCLFMAIALIFRTGSKIGLVSMLISLFFFFFFFFRFSWDLKGRAILRLDKAKILVLLIVIVVVTSILYTSIQSNRHETASISRFKDMFDQGTLESTFYNRGPKWKSALAMLKDYPCTGIGVGAYIVELPNYMAMIWNAQNPHADSAENYFLQVGSELGIIGLIVILWLFGMIGYSLIKYLLNKSCYGSQPYLFIGVGVGIGSYFIHLLYHTYIGSFEIKYIFWLFVTLLFCLIKDTSEQQKNKRDFKIPWYLGFAVIGVFTGLHLWNSSHSLSLKQRTNDLNLKHNFGFYETEKLPSGDEFSWSKQRAGRSITIKGPVLAVPLHASHYDIAENPVHVKIFLLKEFFKEKKLLEEITLQNNGWHTRKYYLPEELNSTVLLFLEVSRTWNPHEILGVPDSRNLGVALGEVRFEELDRDPRYNLLVIVSDALRADALSCYGGEADTPNIDKLAAEGVLFENAYSNSSWTVPSSISMFTGTYPGAFGQLVNEEPDSIGNRPYFMVSNQEVLLAEALEKKGYDVYYDLESGLASRSNVTQGFNDYAQNDYYAAKPRWFWKKALQPEFEGQIYNKDVPTLHYLLSTENKFFFMKWIFDPHAVYSPPKKFKDKINVDVSKLVHEREYYERIGSKHDHGPATLHQAGPTFNEHELRYLKDLYLKEIESVDERVGYILIALDSKRLKDTTIIVFTSDHGESFGEQGRFGHGGLFYEERVHVPLIISGPGIVRGKRVQASVSHIDLMPTLKDLLMVDCLHNAQGKSFKSVLIDEKATLEDREIYFTLGEPLSLTAKKIRDGLKFKNYKMIMLSEKNIRLYDLIDDPDELRDISKKKKILMEELKAKIMAIREENESRRQENLKDLDPETLKKMNKKTREQLRALGYIK